MALPLSIWIGWDSREAAAFAVARSSARRHLTQPIPIRGLVLDELRAKGLYTRPIEYRATAADRPVMWDTISDAPMATEFACSRFIVPFLARHGWALFMDCDFLVRENLVRLFETLDPSKAVYVVKLNYQPTNTTKMDSQVQTRYSRKLWSAFCIFNCDHPSNKALSLPYINSTPGRDLHAFRWLRDDEIGEIDAKWHWVPGHGSAEIDPACVHFSEGGPWFHGYDNVPFGAEWKKHLSSWAIGSASLE